jgi:hypothetical protein
VEVDPRKMDYTGARLAGGRRSQCRQQDFSDSVILVTSFFSRLDL